MSESERGRVLKEQIDARLSEARIHRAWRGVEIRLGQPPARPMRGLAIGGALLAAAAVLAFFMSSRPSSLALESGAAPTEVVANETPRELVFSDASRITLTQGVLSPTRNDAEHFELRLAQGSASFSVTPGGPRRWSIDCGLATVEVVGTVFRIEHQGENALRVTVQHGHVRVVHEAGVRELLAGESFTVRRTGVAQETGSGEHAPARETSEPIPSVEEVLAIAPSDEAAPPAPDSSHPIRNLEVARPWVHLAQEGDYASSYATLGDEGTSAALASASPSELLLLSDVARLSGHPSDAVEPLQRLLRAHARDPNAPLAAIMLGRVYQDALHRPSDAVSALEQARALGPPSSLSADVESRFALALFDAHDPRAVSITERYLAAHPTGPRASLLQARLASSLDDAPAEP